MHLFVGLGNPGPRYAANRHNVGVMAVERIAADHGFGPWRARFQGRLAEGMLGGTKVLLLCPTPFMNLSGQPVGEALRFHRLEPEDVTVFHDELDLAPGRIRAKTGGGHAGHNGLRSLHQHIGEGYNRVRIGIGHPGHKDRVADYVLHDFAKADQDWLQDVLSGISDGAPALVQGDTARFLNAVSLRTQPPRPATGRKAAERGKPPAAAGPAAAPPSAPQPGPQPATGASPAVSPPASSPPAGRPLETSSPGPDTRSALQKLRDRFL